jgi:hypothetical protein
MHRSDANFPFTMPTIIDMPDDAPFGYDDIDHQPRRAVAGQFQADRLARAQAPVESAVAQKVHALEQAAARFNIRRDAFAAGKGDICLDLASKLERFGSFVSEKQAEFADKLIAWSQPREQAPRRVDPVAASLPVLPKLFDLMQRLARLTIGRITISRKNQDSLCWVKLEGQDGVVGKIEGGQLHLFRSKMGAFTASEVLTELVRIEADPEAAAVLHGKASGCCAVCSRDLTDPVSIERGVGPVCLEKAGWA